MSHSNEIFIDFDGTISPCHYPDPLIEPPPLGCVETINKLYDKNYIIVIYSCRANPNILGNDTSMVGVTEMVDYINKHGIKFHRVETNKPLYHLLIDDRALFDKDWVTLGKKLGITE